MNPYHICRQTYCFLHFQNFCGSFAVDITRMLQEKVNIVLCPCGSLCWLYNNFFAAASGGVEYGHIVLCPYKFFWSLYFWHYNNFFADTSGGRGYGWQQVNISTTLDKKNKKTLINALNIVTHVIYFCRYFEEGGYGRQQVTTSHQSAGTKPLACCRSVKILLERVWQKSFSKLFPLNDGGWSPKYDILNIYIFKHFSSPGKQLGFGTWRPPVNLIWGGIHRKWELRHLLGKKWKRVWMDVKFPIFVQ